MAEVQQRERERQESSSAPVDVRLSTMEDKARLRRKKLADKAADYIITAGGIAVILSIVAILFVIVAETLPLWNSPIATPVATLNLSQSTPQSSEAPTPSATTSPEKLLAFGVDEYQSIAYVLRDNGTVDFLALPNNQLIQRYEVKALQGQQATAAYRDGISHVIVIGTVWWKCDSVAPQFFDTISNRETRDRT